MDLCRYKLHQKSYLRSDEDPVEIVHNEGDVILVGPECPPGPHWQPLNAAAKAAVAHFKANPLKPGKLEDMPMVQFNTDFEDESEPTEAVQPVPIEPAAQKVKRAYTRRQSV